MSVLDRLVGPGWLAVGDAASERDPITGCGIHDALLDAADAAWTIAAAVGERESPPWRYEDRVRSRFETHLQTRAALYASERRWPTEPFWQGRAFSAQVSGGPSDASAQLDHQLVEAEERRITGDDRVAIGDVGDPVGALGGGQSSRPVGEADGAPGPEGGGVIEVPDLVAHARW